MTKDVKIRAALFAATLLSMVWGFRLLIFDHAPAVFSSTIEDLSYGWYVPVFSAYVLWRERRELAASVGETRTRPRSSSHATRATTATTPTTTPD